MTIAMTFGPSRQLGACLLQVTVDLSESQKKTDGSIKDLNNKITAALADLVQASLPAPLTLSRHEH